MARTLHEQSVDMNRRSVRWGIILALAALAILPYASAIQNGFVYYDDNQYVTENAIVQSGLTWHGIKWAFTTFTASNWHPLTWLSHMLDVEVWGLWAGGHHLTNILFHAANTVILFSVLLQLTRGLWRSALVAALFAVHPLHVESVAWIAERKDVLSAFFGFLAIGCYARYVQRTSFANYGFAMALFALSLMSKPMLVTLPCVLLLLDVWPLTRFVVKESGAINRAEIGRALLEKIPFFVMSALSSMTTMAAQHGAVTSLEVISMPQRISNAILAYATYLAKTVWPANLSVIYPFSFEKPPSLVMIAAISLMAITAIAVFFSRKQPAIIIGWLWFLGTLVPVIGVVQVGEQSMADRYTYFPLIGLFIALAWGLPEALLQSRSVLRAVRAAAMLAVVALGIGAALQVRHWKDTLSLFSRAASVTEQNYVAENSLGNEYHKRGDAEKAMEHLRKALQWRPQYASAHNNMAAVLVERGEFASAEEHYKSSLNSKSDEAMVWNNLGVTQLNQSKVEEAMKSFREALRIDAHHAEALANLGTALVAQGKFQEARDLCEQSLAARSDYATAHAGLGAALWNLGERDQAVAHYQRALELNPNLTTTRINLGVAMASQGRYDLAIPQFERVLKSDPNNETARGLLEVARQQQRDAVSPPK